MNPLKPTPLFEKVVTPENSSLVLERETGRVLPCIYHYHPEYELTYLTKGSGNVLIGSGIEPFRPGHLALLGPNIPHHYASAPSEEPSESYVVKFRENCFGPDFWNLKEMAALKQLLAQALRGIALRPEDGLKFGGRIETLFLAPPPLRIARFLELLYDLTTAPKHFMLTLPQGKLPDDINTERIERALVYINAHFASGVTLTQAGRAAGLAPAVFSRVFSRVVRKPFSRYLLELRLSDVCRRLTDSRGEIAEIAGECGFRNLSNFNRLFRRNKGMTPKEFRRLATAALGRNS